MEKRTHQKNLQIPIANTDCNNEDQQEKRKCSTCEIEVLGNRKYLNHLTMKDTNGEFVETVHSSLRRYEETHGTKIVRKKVPLNI